MIHDDSLADAALRALPLSPAVSVMLSIIPKAVDITCPLPACCHPFCLSLYLQIRAMVSIIYVYSLATTLDCLSICVPPRLCTLGMMFVGALCSHTASQLLITGKYRRNSLASIESAVGSCYMLGPIQISSQRWEKTINLQPYTQPTPQCLQAEAAVWSC